MALALELPLCALATAAAASASASRSACLALLLTANAAISPPEARGSRAGAGCGRRGASRRLGDRGRALGRARPGASSLELRAWKRDCAAGCRVAARLEAAGGSTRRLYAPTRLTKGREPDACPGPARKRTIVRPRRNPPRRRSVQNRRHLLLTALNLASLGARPTLMAPPIISPIGFLRLRQERSVRVGPKVQQ